MKLSSSFKVGLLALLALVLLLGIVLKVKGRAFSNAARIEVQFNDVNGMRPGAGVQMMGLKVGQVEEITPVITEDNNYVNLKFVITEPDVTIPKASMFSIQQSGLIGELFLEITPPKTRTLYLPVVSKDILYKDDPVQMKLDSRYYDVGLIKNIEIISRDALPYSAKESVTTNSAYKVDYIINLPGLILPEFMKGSAVNEQGAKKLRIATLDDVILPHPKQTSPYTIVEPMRIADFMDWQYRAAESLTETNRKINELLSDEVIAELRLSVENIASLTEQTNSTMTKINDLIDSSKGDIEKLMTMADKATNDFHKLSEGLSPIVSDPQFKKKVYSTVDSIDNLSKNLNKIIGNEQEAKQLAADMRATVHNINEISKFVNSLTKDDQLKSDLTRTVNSVNNAMLEISSTLETVNKLTPENKTELAQIVDDAAVTTSNLKKFSEKLNKRFLLFRLMF
ncbi:MAG: MlaD family protein [Heliobacteriaceae bacterium]|jgi:phospholipid/cholesterol/gamma-HCH transport system substrate-binding protein|nr:MlaD family protein [Heliobacteriaceae bacterium]